MIEVACVIFSQHTYTMTKVQQEKMTTDTNCDTKSSLYRTRTRWVKSTRRLIWLAIGRLAWFCRTQPNSCKRKQSVCEKVCVLSARLGDWRCINHAYSWSGWPWWVVKRFSRGKSCRKNSVSDGSPVIIGGVDPAVFDAANNKTYEGWNVVIASVKSLGSRGSRFGWRWFWSL